MSQAGTVLSDPTPLDVDGRRLLVVGTGEPLAQTLARLHRLGAACQAVDDPYHAMVQVATRSDLTAVVVVLPCLYPEELSFVAAIRRLKGLPVVLAAADGLLAMLTAAIRFGATHLLDGNRLESFTPGSAVAAKGLAGPDAALEHTGQRAASPSPAPSSPEATAEVAACLSGVAEPPPTVQPPSRRPEPLAVEPPNDSHVLADDGLGSGEPLLTAEELRALLQEPLPATPRGVSHARSSERFTDPPGQGISQMT